MVMENRTVLSTSQYSSLELMALPAYVCFSNAPPPLVCAWNMSWPTVHELDARRNKCPACQVLTLYYMLWTCLVYHPTSQCPSDWRLEVLPPADWIHQARVDRMWWSSRASCKYLCICAWASCIVSNVSATGWDVLLCLCLQLRNL